MIAEPLDKTKCFYYITVCKGHTTEYEYNEWAFEHLEIKAGTWGHHSEIGSWCANYAEFHSLAVF